jgi:hypothetical protein
MLPTGRQRQKEQEPAFRRALKLSEAKLSTEPDFKEIHKLRALVNRVVDLLKKENFL